VASVPAALADEAGLAARLAGRRPAVFLDYDGVLSPIVENPADAVLGDGMRAALRRLAARVPCAIVSGRDLDDVLGLVGEDALYYAGSHGFDLAGPAGWRETVEKGRAFLPALAAAAEALEAALAPVPGARVERKRFSLAVHDRQVAAGDEGRVEAAVRAAIEDAPRLKASRGKKVWDVKPRVEWNKGYAVLALLEELRLDRADVLPIYLGDDTTDEDAFRALAGRGLGLVVRDGSEDRRTAADAALEGTARSSGSCAGWPGWGRASGGRAMSGWTLAYDGYEPGREGVREALCTLGNGYFCTRARRPTRTTTARTTPAPTSRGSTTGRPRGWRGATWRTRIWSTCRTGCRSPAGSTAGRGCGSTRWRSWTTARSLTCGRGCCGALRLRDGEGRVLGWSERRFVSMAEKHMAGLEVTLAAENWSGRLEIRSGLDGGVVNNNVARYRTLERRHLEPLGTDTVGEAVMRLRARTAQSRVEVVEAARTLVFRDGAPLAAERRTEAGRARIDQILALDMAAGERVTVEKVVALFASTSFAISEPGLAAAEAVAAADGFEALLARHVAAWAELWDDFDIGLAMAEPDGIEMKLRLHVFHLLQTVSQNTIDADIGVPARGWHGEAYRGHIFWDELFILPFLNFRRPLITRALLKYRHRRLDAARRHARAEGYAGALFRGSRARTGGRRRRSCTSTRSRAPGCPTTRTASATSTPRSPTTSGATTR
jgi:alpha,alpha-trehalase